MIYAIGDIHGQKDLLDHALSLIAKDGGPDAEIVFIGDYTDRGPDSRGVLDTLIAGQKAGKRWTCLKGNHDRMLHRFVAQGIEHDARVSSGISWINPRLGGVTTLASYGVEGEPHFITPHGGKERLVAFDHITGTLTPAELREHAADAIPDDHLAFLADLPLTYATDDLLFVHAGLRPGVPLSRQTEDDLLWIRKEWLSDSTEYERLIVHGHTALDFPQHNGNRINLDGGAGYGRPLVPVVFEGRECWTLSTAGRQLLWPHL